ncbi:MAG: VapC toxin family PIN domain ribonuclease [Burkholderiaceae bacterium]|jgi:predicted nucleic acid-binding protein|nr:VapC toxin family PIN domain ribonuclease [Burkholderiaceae bacterium]
MPTAVLVDTSVWVDHFRRHNIILADLLVQERVLMHPFVLTELACGTPPAPRARTLRELALLRMANQASQQEVLDFIKRERLHGQGCGLVDVTLLASALMTPSASLWTLDQSLAALARRFGVDHAELLN